MTERHEEKEFWERFLNQEVTLLKKVNDKGFYYTGFVIKVLDDKIIFDDRKIGQIPLTFDDLSVIEVQT